MELEGGCCKCVEAIDTWPSGKTLFATLAFTPDLLLDPFSM